MKAYKMTDLIKKDEKSLNEDMAKLNAQLNDVRVKATTRKLSDDSSEQKKIRKQIARIQTALNTPKVEVKAAKKETKEDTKSEAKEK